MNLYNNYGKPKIMVECKRVNTTFFPEEITSMILKKISEVAESYLGEPIKDAVITVPHSF